MVFDVCLSLQYLLYRIDSIGNAGLFDEMPRLNVIVEQDEKLCDELKAVKEFTYLGERVSAGGGCEAAVTARTRCRWVRLNNIVIYNIIVEY